MPTLRVELLKVREEDDTKNMMTENTKAVHSSRVNMLAGYPHHSTKLRYSISEPQKHRSRVDKAIVNKAVPSVGRKLSKNEIKRSTLQDASKGRMALRSPSESDSFSIRSSSSSSKSEASDSTKKPSTPTSLMKPSVASLSISLGSYLGAQAVEMWNVHHVPPSDFSKAIQEKLHGESKTLQDCFLEFKFSQGNIVENHLQRQDEDKVSNRCDNLEHINSDCMCKHGSPQVEGEWARKSSTPCDNSEHVRSGCVRKHDCVNGEEDCAHGSVNPAVYRTTAPSQEASPKTSCHMGAICKASFIGEESKHTQSIRELMGQHQGSHEETGGLHGRHEWPCHMEAQDQVQPEHTGHSMGAHVLQSKHDEDFSFEALPIHNMAYMPDISPCRHTSVDRSTYPEVVADYQREVSARVSLEKYVFTTPLMGRSVSSIPIHSERDDYLSGPAALSHCHDVMKKVTRAEVGTLTPPPVHEIRCKVSSDACTPVSPLSVGEDGNYQNFDEYNGKEYADGGTWFTTSKAQLPLHSPSKAHWDWRSRSLGARASLKSAVRNLEAAFGGSRSVSLPKTRSQTQQREMKPESSTFFNRVFVSPAKARQKHSELSKPIQRFSYSGEQLIQGSTRSRRELHTDDNRGDRTGASRHSVLLPLPLSKQHHQSDIPELKFSTVPFAPASKGVHRLGHLKRLSGHTSPLASRPPASSSHQPKVDTCMLQGYLQCIVRDGFASYTLSLKDSEEMLLAKACPFAHDSSKDSGKCMYTFHSGKSKSRGKGANGWRSWLKKDSKLTADRAGKMQVLSQLCSEVSPAGRRRQTLVSEFVLYDKRNDDAVRSQSLRFLSSGIACHNTRTPAVSPPSVRSAYELFGQPSTPNLQKQASDIPKSPSSGRMSLKSVNSNQVQPYSPLSSIAAAHRSSNSIDVWSDSDATEPDVECLRSYPSLRTELAAIVTKMPMDDLEMDGHLSPTGGACKRSLKFSDDELKGCQQVTRDVSAHGVTADSIVACGTKYGQILGNRATLECVTMMLPKEHHGLPKGGVHGPTSLIERWRCGGKCDCEGWDLGCGMDIFSTQVCENAATTAGRGNSIQSLSHNQPLIIYSQGKVRKMLLNLSIVQEGYFILKFRSDLSPLKAFAASVAILHSREFSLATSRFKHTENAYNQQCQAISETSDSVSGGYDERPAFLEVCKEIPTWCPSNHLASPQGRPCGV